MDKTPTFLVAIKIINKHSNVPVAICVRIPPRTGTKKNDIAHAAREGRLDIRTKTGNLPWLEF